MIILDFFEEGNHVLDQLQCNNTDINQPKHNQIL